MTDPEAEALRARVEEGVRRLKEWPERDRSFLQNLPDYVLCDECYLEGWEPQPKHALIVVCPRETGFLVSYTWNPEAKRLVVTNKYAIASDALQRVMEALPMAIAVQTPDASGRWVQMVGMPAWTAMVEVKIMGEAVRENLDRALAAEAKVAELLTALEAMVGQWHRTHNVGHDGLVSLTECSWPQCIAARAAINKARGGGA